MRTMIATPSQARNADPLKVTSGQQHASHEAKPALQNRTQAIHYNPTEGNKFKLSELPQMHHVSPPRRRYPTLITFLNGQPIPHPLRIPPPQSPIHKSRQRACLPPLRAQPAIIIDVTEANSCRQRASRKQSETIKSVFVTGKRFSRWLVDEDRVLVNAYRKHGNDWCTIAKLLPGRSPLAVRKRFHGKIRDQFGFALKGKNLCTCT